MKDLIKIQISHQLEKFGLVRKRIELRKILDRNYKVIEGTIPDKPDNDSAWLFALSSRCRNIFDIGANIGQSAMLMLYNSSIENIVLIDPNPKALSTAAENLIMNSLSNKAKFINAFVSDKNEGVVDFFTIGGGAAGSKFQEFAKTASKLNSHFKVNTMTVDHIVQQTGISPQLVKVDVEGAEIDVLNGACDLAKKADTLFMVETHSGEGLSITDNTKLILDWCNENNYSGWYLKTKTQLDIDSIKKRGRYHSLLIPKNKPFPEYLKSINESDNLSGA
jgi:FkbM family methyltransferase